MMTLTIGRRLRARVATFAEASRIYSQLRDESGEGGSTFPTGRLTSGKAKYFVSYNGRIWSGDPRGPHSQHTLVFDNRIERSR